MSWGDFLKKNLMSFFIIVTVVSAVIGILGLIYEPERMFGYEAYFSPLIFGVIGVLPSIIIYSKRELNIRQMLFRKVLQLIVLEISILTFGYVMGAIKDEMLFTVGLSIILIFVIVHLLSWLIDSKKAEKLTANLKAFQQR